MESIEEVIQTLKEKIEIPLELDGYGGCMILLDESMPLHIESEPSMEKILIMAEIGEIPGGAFRENVFRVALRANAEPPPRFGIFAFSPQNDHLILFEYLPLRPLTPESLLGFLEFFVEKAKEWHENIKTGQIPILEKKMQNPNLFGMR